MSQRRALAVGVDRSTIDSAREKLIDRRFELDRTPTARSALTLASQVKFDLLVVRHPLPGLQVRVFLRTLRDDSSASKDARVIVLAEDTGDRELIGFQAHATEIIPRTDALIGDLTSKVLGGEPRSQVSVMVRLEVELTYGRSMRICQSENLSKSGMLVRTEDRVPVGTKARVSFKLRSGDDPVEAEALVVRETVPGEIPGLALHFESFRNDGRERLTKFMTSRLSA